MPPRSISCRTCPRSRGRRFGPATSRDATTPRSPASCAAQKASSASARVAAWPRSATSCNGNGRRDERSDQRRSPRVPPRAGWAAAPGAPVWPCRSRRWRPSPVRRSHRRPLARFPRLRRQGAGSAHAAAGHGAARDGAHDGDVQGSRLQRHARSRDQGRRAAAVQVSSDQGPSRGFGRRPSRESLPHMDR